MRTYFANDDSYGDAGGIIILNTTDWPDWVWDYISENPYRAAAIVRNGLVRGKDWYTIKTDLLSL